LIGLRGKPVEVNQRDVRACTQESDEDDRIARRAKYAFDGVAADGKSFSSSFTVKYDGKDYLVTGTEMPAEGHDRQTARRNQQS